MANLAPVKTYVYKKIKALWRGAVGAFVLETASRIAIDTGMSVASLRPLGSKVRLKTTLIESFRGKGPKPPHKNLQIFTDNNGLPKSEASGEMLGQKAYKLSFGTKSMPNLIFEFKIVVFQHYIHESGAHAANSKNWESLSYGQEAFIRFIEDNYARYIGNTIIADYINKGILPFIAESEVL